MSAAATVSSPESRVASEPLGPLGKRLAAADRILQKERGGSLLLRAWPWVVGFVVVAFTVDVVLHLAAGIRLGIAAGFALLVFGGAIWCACAAWVRRNPFEHTARILESRHPRLGSKLINLFQLRSQTQDPTLAPLTRELAGLAIAGYADELRQEPIEQLARTNRLHLEAKSAAYGLAGFVAVLAVFFDLTKTEVPRFLDPFGDHPPYSFTRLEISDPPADGATVIYGQSLLITAKSSGHRPGDLYLSCFPAGYPEETTTVPMFDKGERGFTQQIENVRTNLVVFAHTKNRHALSRQRRISVILTPRLEKAWVKITPPAYTGLAPDEKPLNFKSVKALVGSILEFRLESNRPLASGHLTVETANAVEPFTMSTHGPNEVIGAIEAKQPAQLKFSLIDRDGFPSQETWETALTVTHDLPPEVQVTNPSSDSFVAMDFKAEPLIEASDDYGVQTLRIHTARNGIFGDPRVITQDHAALHARETLAFDFQQMGLASGDTISVFAEAIDNAPEPHLTRSKTVTFTVITAEEYNAFLRERTDLGDIEAKYAKLVNEFHDLAEQQKKLGEEIAALKQQLAAAKTSAEKAGVQKKLDELLAKQADLNAKLNQLAETMEHFVRDQPLYDVEAELKNTLAEKAQEIRDSTKVNADATKQLRQPSTPGQQPPSQKMLEDFKQASDDQLARLGATEQEARDQVLKPLEDLSLMHEIIKDINRFKDLYAAQQELAKQSKAYDRPTPLSREDQLALKDLAAQQKLIGDELDAVEQKLWEDGKAAQEKFPKAGESAQDIAQRMGDLKLQTLANKAMGEMLAGRGDNGSQLAETLRGEMEKLFSQCNGKGNQMNDELDQYLSIQRAMNPRQSFQQMMQCKKFGTGRGFKPGNGGEGNGGSDGYAVMTGPEANVLGNEARVSAADKAQMNGQGKNKATPDDPNPGVALDKPDVVHGVNPVNRESEAVQGETTIEQYSDIVEKYFRAITKEPKKATKP